MARCRVRHCETEVNSGCSRPFLCGPHWQSLPLAMRRDFSALRRAGERTTQFQLRALDYLTERDRQHV